MSISTFSAAWRACALAATILLPSASSAQTVLLGNNVPKTPLSGTSGGQQYYKISIPSGATQLNIRTSGGVGDSDLYLRRGSLPTTSLYDGRSNLRGNNETLLVTNPIAGDWYIMLRGWSAYSGVTVVAAYSASWDFNQSSLLGAPPFGWEDDSLGTLPRTYLTTLFQGSGCLQIRNVNSTDRMKVRTKGSDFRNGTYEWRVYIPYSHQTFAQTSIGAFLYSPLSSSAANRSREIDFEIGYGKKADRASARIPDGKLMAYMVLQEDINSSTAKWYRTAAIDPDSWYTLRVNISVVSGKYKILWTIRKEGGPEVTYGPATANYGPETNFWIETSLENLAFMGDVPAVPPKAVNFDSVNFKP